MDRAKNGNYRVTRDDARLFKLGAALLNNTELTKIYAHYLGVRQASGIAIAALQIRKPKGAFEEEIKSLPALVEYQGGNPSVSNMRYIYSPHLMEASIENVRTLVIDNHAITDVESAEIQELCETYDSLHKDKAPQTTN